MSSGHVSSKEFAITDQMEVEVLLQPFVSKYQYSEKPLSRANEYYYDTFDWRLYKQGFLLKRRGKYLYLCSTDGSVIYKEAGSGTKRFFAADLQESVLRQKVEGITGVRAISEILYLKKRSRQFDLLNKDRKTVARLFHEQALVSADGKDEKELCVLRIVQVRGYEKVWSKVLQIAGEQKRCTPVDGQTLFQRGLAAIGREPGDYTSVVGVTLKNDDTLADASSRICFRLATTLEQNYQGVVEDIDIEFLHDFRVAIRRTRSFISQFKKFFPAKEIAFFNNEFKWLGALTGPVRDLDVYLLKRNEYASKIPDDLHPGLEQFFVDLKTKRQEKFAEMKQGLSSDRYGELLARWKTFIKPNGHNDQQQSTGQCLPIARKKIRKCLKKIVKDGNRLDNNSSAEEFHRLRIQGKKLRYLVEFFRSLFDANEVEYFRKQLKTLQNMLGDFNDISVQLKLLLHFQQALTGRSKRSIAIATAIGGLITQLTVEHGALRKRFTNVFFEFASPKNIERFYAALVSSTGSDYKK